MSDIVVTGIGPVSALGIGRVAWTEGLRAGRSGIGPVSLFATDGLAGEVRGFKLAEILPSMKTYNDRASEFTLAACHLALQDAGLSADGYDRWRAGIILGSTYGCLSTLYTYTAALQQKGPRFANPLLFSHTYVNTPTSLAAIEYGLGGHHGTYAGHDAGHQALAAAREALQLGRADLLLVVGVDVLSEPLARASTAPDAPAAPLGEGACALVLETAAHAAARGAAGVPLPDALPDGAALRPLLGNTLAAEPVFALARFLTESYANTVTP